MTDSTITAFCEHETFTCLICQIIIGIAPRCCKSCSPEEGFIEINGVDSNGDAVCLKYHSESMTVIIKANKQAIERHMPTVKKLLHYPELVSFNGCDGT